MTVFPFSEGKSIVWDATCTDTFAATNIARSATNAGATAENAETNKKAKYSDLVDRYYFAPLAFETTGATGPTTTKLKVLKELASRVAVSQDNRREITWMFQNLSIAIL
ncbi:MAG: hypothetical protein ACKE51_02530 [Methylococcaceae bacterium]